MDTPANEMNTDTFVEEVKRIGQELGVACTIIQGEQLRYGSPCLSTHHYWHCKAEVAIFRQLRLFLRLQILFSVNFEVRSIDNILTAPSVLVVLFVDGLRSVFSFSFSE